MAGKRARPRNALDAKMRTMQVQWRNRVWRGGAQHVTGNDTIGQPGRCWCGQPGDHDWPGQDAGEPHPR